jgi:bifunctional isochorismate lyase/aryl carrier protein
MLSVELTPGLAKMSSMKSPNRLGARQIERYELPGPECRQLNKIQWRVDVSDAVLLVHDMQRYFCDFFADADPVVQAVQRLIAHARAAGIPIVYSRAEKRPPAERGLALEMWGEGMSAADVAQEQTDFVAAVAPQPADHVVTKSRYSAFYETPLAGLLAGMDRRHIVLCGVFAHHGVLLTAADAYMRDIRPTLVADALGDYSRDDHWQALRYVSEVCGQILMLEDIAAEWDNAAR